MGANPEGRINVGGQAVMELCVLDRFRQIRDKSDVLQLGSLASATYGGEHDEKGILQFGVGFDLLSEGLSVHVRHLHVQQSDPEWVAPSPGLF